MNWKLPVLVVVGGLGGLALLGVLALHLLGTAGISVSLYSIEVEPNPFGIWVFPVIALSGLITYVVFRKFRSTSKP